jgi:hypothetical protein
MRRMFNNSNLYTENYDAILIGWSSLNLQASVKLGAFGITYCNVEQARQMIIDAFGWTINDTGLAAGCSLGIDKITASLVFIYPKPTKGILKIEGNQSPENISLYNLIGKEALSSNNTNRIDVNTLFKGLYFITIIDENNSATKKFIKE